ncbi:hypothetical protein KKB55_04105 [Myxococcota bacterium]|nr:hypothetical protein [Myxococcota bacterium]MBU1896934.1 hypothetical protein [Myxococcota bacterium]
MDQLDAVLLHGGLLSPARRMRSPALKRWGGGRAAHPESDTPRVF